MAHKSIYSKGKAVLDEGDYFNKKCMWCNKECEISEVLWNGEEVEGWTYCPDCKTDTFHPILNDNKQP